MTTTFINHDNAEAIKRLADRLEYTIKDTKKVMRVSPSEDYSFAWDMYQEDMQQLYSEVKEDIISVYNANERDYSNILGEKQEQINNGIDLERIKGLTKKEKDIIDEAYIEEDKTLQITWNTDIPSTMERKIESKILASITIEEKRAHGYSQGDWDVYAIAYYNDASKEKQKTIELLIDNIKHLFTVCEFYVELIHIETRVYTSGIEEVVEVEQESYSATSYSGDNDNETLGLTDYIKEGYTREDKER